MQLLLAFLFAMVVLGFNTERLGPRVYLAIIGTAVFTTAVFYGTTRFMK